MKEIKINVPEGYEIDKENSTFECIKFKKLDNKPRSWEEYSISVENKSTFYANAFNKTMSSHHTGLYSEFFSEDEAKAFVALGKLIQLRDAWWGNWRPDWEDSSVKYVIVILNTPVSHETACINRILAFPTTSMRDDFLNTFKDLIEEAKMFL